MTTIMMLVMFTVMLQCYCNWKKTECQDASITSSYINVTNAFFVSWKLTYTFSSWTKSYQNHSTFI